LAESHYCIFETRRFIAALQRLDPSVRLPIQRKLEEYVYPQLRREPHVGPNIKKLRDWVPEAWRYRIGPWRFFYEIHESERMVYLLTVDHRGEAYR